MNKNLMDSENKVVNKVVETEDISDEEFNSIVEGWDPSLELKGVIIKWDRKKRKWIVVK